MVTIVVLLDHQYDEERKPQVQNVPASDWSDWPYGEMQLLQAKSAQWMCEAEPQWIYAVAKQTDWCCSEACERKRDTNKSGHVSGLGANPSNADIMAAIEKLTESIEFCSVKYDTVVSKLESIESRMDRIEKENESLRSQLRKQGDTQKNIKKYTSQKALECNVIIAGVQNEVDTNDAVQKIASKLDGCQNICESVTKSARLFAQLNSTAGNTGKVTEKIPIVVTFASVEKKCTFIAAFKKKQALLASECSLPGGTSNIVCMEQLSKFNYDLLKEARTLKEAGIVKFVWFQNSSVLVRKDENSKIIRISSTADIEKVKTS